MTRAQVRDRGSGSPALSPPRRGRRGRGRRSRADQYAYEARLRDLEDIYTAAQLELAVRIERAIHAGDVQTIEGLRAQLGAAVRVLDELGATVTPIARQLVADAYQQGADRVLVQIRQLRLVAPELPGSFAGVQRDAVRQLQNAILGRVDIAQRTIGRQIEDVYAREQRRAAMRALLGADGSPRTAAKALRERLLLNPAIADSVRESGVGFVDSAGKRWQLDTYAKMATRTITREAAVQGAIARMTSHGIDLARVSNHGTDCPICQPWEGVLVSLSGDITEYEGEKVTTGGDVPPFHPGCRHSLQPVATRIEALARELDQKGV